MSMVEVNDVVEQQTSIYEELANDPKYVKAIAGNATQSERTSWNRKRERLEFLVTEFINPISEEIAKLEIMQRTHLDEVQTIREEMVNTCIHPKDSLAVQVDGSYQCKFCEKKMKVVNHE